MHGNTAEATLNLLRPSASCLSKSAWEHVCGAYDFNAVPLAPPGTRAVILDPASSRPSWAKHGTDCFFVGPALSHYRCYTFYIPSTRSTPVSDSVAWFSLPSLMSASTLAQSAITDISVALTQLSSSRNDDSPKLFHLAHQLAAMLSSAINALDPSRSPPPAPPSSSHLFVPDTSLPTWLPTYSPPHIKVILANPALIRCRCLRMFQQH